MSDVVLAEVLAVVERLEPELTKGLALGVGTHDTVKADEAGESNAIKSFLIEDGGRVADAFGHICD